MKKLIAIILFLFGFLYTGFSQTTSKKDTLKNILNSEFFSLEESYQGDWGGYTYNFTFTKKDKKVLILWENPPFKENEKFRSLNILLPNTELNNMEKMFVNCIAKISVSKKGSTEHVFYKFKNKNMLFVIDDKSSMECVNNFNIWKERIFQEGLKQEKNKK